GIGTCAFWLWVVSSVLAVQGVSFRRVLWGSGLGHQFLPRRGFPFCGWCGVVGWVTSSCRAWGFLSVGGVGWWVGSPVLAAHGGSLLWVVWGGGLGHQCLPRMGVPFCGWCGVVGLIRRSCSACSVPCERGVGLAVGLEEPASE